MSETINSAQNKLNTYTFSGIRWIPSYRDFDMDDADIEAANEKEAYDALFKVMKYWKTVGITHVNGIKVGTPLAEVKEPKRKYFKGTKSLKSLALDFIQSKGSAKPTEIRKFLYETSNPGKTYDPFLHRGFYSSYFSSSGSYLASLKGYPETPAALKSPSKNEQRQAVKLPSGVYAVVKCVFNVPKI